MKTRATLAAAGLLVALLAAGGPARADDAKAACFDAADKGQTLRDAHKLVEARERFRSCAAAVCPAAVQNDCAGWLADAEKAIPTVVLSAKDAAGNDAFDVSVRVDGAPLASKLDGAALPVDPGPHVFRFQWPGGEANEKQVLVPEGQKAMVVSVALAAPPPKAPPTAPPAPAPPAEARSGLRSAGFAVGAVGLAGLVVGGVLGGLTFSEVSRAKSACGAAGCANNTSQTAVNDMSTARTFGDVSTASFVAGGALLAGGLVMVLVGWPSSKAEKSASGLVVAPTWTPGGAALGVRGAF